MFGACYTRAWSARGQGPARSPSTSGRVCNSGHLTRCDPAYPIANFLKISGYFCNSLIILINLKMKIIFISLISFETIEFGAFEFGCFLKKKKSSATENPLLKSLTILVVKTRN